MSSRRRIFGVDPGLARFGWAVVDRQGMNVHLAASGCLTTRAGQTVQARLVHLFINVQRLIARYEPQAMALEKLFFTRNVSTAMVVSEARGVAVLAAGLTELKTIELTPTAIKQSVAGYGRAEKRQVERMVTTLLRLPHRPSSDDEADAMAIALCGAQMHWS